MCDSLLYFAWRCVDLLNLAWASSICLLRTETTGTVWDQIVNAGRVGELQFVRHRWCASAATLLYFCSTLLAQLWAFQPQPSAPSFK
jgi:hypothetical protein